mmetsp:Transcript_33527/g.92597  ORF Transcript_33527/g.92597 Transcript_33527/m.92597 type:complete len:269 (+) Transcript_33527:1035-1841(+)
MVQEACMRGVEGVLHGHVVTHRSFGHDPLCSLALGADIWLNCLGLNGRLKTGVREYEQQPLADLHGKYLNGRALQLAHPRLLLFARGHGNLDALAVAGEAPPVVAALQRAVPLHGAEGEGRHAVRASILCSVPLALRVHPDDDALPEDLQRIRLGLVQVAHRADRVPCPRPDERVALGGGRLLCNWDCLSVAHRRRIARRPASHPALLTVPPGEAEECRSSASSRSRPAPRGRLCGLGVWHFERTFGRQARRRAERRQRRAACVDTGG